MTATKQNQRQSLHSNFGTDCGILYYILYYIETMEDSFDRLFSYLRSVGAVTKDEDKADGKKQNKSEKKNRDGNESLSDEQEIISSSPEKSTSGIRLSKDWSQDLLGIYAQFELESLAPSQMANGSRNASRTSSAASLQRIVSKDDSGVTSTSSGEETSSAFAPSSPQSEPALHQDPDVSFHLKQATTLDLPWNIRSDSVQYLGNSNLHRDSTVIQYLLQALSSDPHWRVRQNAAVSLAIVGSKELPKVVEGLKTAFQRDKETKSKAAVALGRLGIRDQEIIATLQRSLRDDNQFDTIKEASEALEQLGITSDSHSPSTSPTPQPIVNRRTMLYGNQRESMRSISIGIKGKYFRSRSLSSGSESDASMGSPRKVDYRIKLQVSPPSSSTIASSHGVTYDRTSYPKEIPHFSSANFFTSTTTTRTCRFFWKLKLSRSCRLMKFRRKLKIFFRLIFQKTLNLN
eukprot:TRINITY_DN559_c5_g1_i2.p1 TRINITY_DN559_c5_g1~~TRINITY_DN559_c5_g1_i2.p1  ORF type:complete len:461 (-),score=106.11 TRINITY_DN559_c5_g1_i2:332-1714(-)